MSGQEVAQKQSQEVAPSQDGMMESKEYHAKGSANAGLNLNIFGAVSGIFNSKSKKETAADGSSVEHKDEQGRMKGAGAGNLQAQGAADAEEHGREMRQAINEGKSDA